MTRFINICLEILMVAPLGAIFALIAAQWAPLREGQEK
jgi:hypothetical protein